MNTSTFSPQNILILGFGEAGKAIATGLCAPDGWRASHSAHSLRAIDPVYGQGVRGEAMRASAASLDIPVSIDYDPSIAYADLVISVVTGEAAVSAAREAKSLLKPRTLYADFNSITGPQTQAVAAEFSSSSIDFVDVAVMGSFIAAGHRTPLLVSGPRCADMCDFAASIGTPATSLSHNIGDASAVKILRSVLMKGIEALSVECLVAARRQGLVDQVLGNIGDVDAIGLAEFIRVLTITHLTHARRRMEEVEKAIQNLDETGVPALMCDAIRRSHQRTVDANLDPAEIAAIDLDRALEILDAQVVNSPR